MTSSDATARQDAKRPHTCPTMDPALATCARCRADRADADLDRWQARTAAAVVFGPLNTRPGHPFAGHAPALDAPAQRHPAGHGALADTAHRLGQPSPAADRTQREV